MCIMTEIVTMKLKEGITKEEFIRSVEGLEKNFHSTQPGFLDTELLYEEANHQWIMIQHWESLEQLKAASGKLLKDSAAESFVRCLDSKSVKMTIAPQVKVWR